MSSIKICIPGDPIPLARGRVTNYRVWDSQKKIKLEWSFQIDQQNPDKQYLEGPLSLDVVFYMRMPAGMSQKQKNLIVGTPHVFRPDISNMLKFVEDCAQEILFKDDCQICTISSKKVYDTKPRTEFIISELS